MKLRGHPVDNREPWNDDAVVEKSGTRVAACGEARAMWLRALGYEGGGAACWGAILEGSVWIVAYSKMKTGWRRTQRWSPGRLREVGDEADQWVQAVGEREGGARVAERGSKGAAQPSGYGLD